LALGRNASSLGAFPFGATLSDRRKRLLAINELAAVGLSAANGNFFAQFGKPQLFQFLALLEKPQTFPKDFTLRLVVASLEKIGNKLVKYDS
jgi:hypothetical protein